MSFRTRYINHSQPPWAWLATSIVPKFSILNFFMFVQPIMYVNVLMPLLATHTNFVVSVATDHYSCYLEAGNGHLSLLPAALWFISGGLDLDLLYLDVAVSLSYQFWFSIDAVHDSFQHRRQPPWFTYLVRGACGNGGHSGAHRGLGGTCVLATNRCELACDAMGCGRWRHQNQCM